MVSHILDDANAGMVFRVLDEANVGLVSRGWKASMTSDEAVRTATQEIREEK